AVWSRLIVLFIGSVMYGVSSGLYLPIYTGGLWTTKYSFAASATVRRWIGEKVVAAPRTSSPRSAGREWTSVEAIVVLLAHRDRVLLRRVDAVFVFSRAVVLERVDEAAMRIAPCLVGE